jgi:hypothetical protein
MSIKCTVTVTRKDDEFGIAAHGDAYTWQNLAQSLRLDPHHNAHIPLPK